MTTPISPPSTPFPGIDDARYLVSGRDGIWIVEPEGNHRQVSELPASVAFGDFADGVVVQVSDVAPGGPPDGYGTRIGRLQPGSGVEWILQEPGYWLFLHDVALIDGTPWLVVGRQLDTEVGNEGSGLQDLFLYDLETGHRRPLTTVEVGEGVADVDYAFGLFVVTVDAEGFSWFEFYDLEGERVVVPANPAPSDRRDPSTVGFGRWAGSPEDPVLVFLAADGFAPPFEVMLGIGLTDGEVRFRLPLPAPGSDDAFETFVDADGDVLVVSRERPLGEAPWWEPDFPVVVDLPDGARVERLPVPGIATAVGR